MSKNPTIKLISYEEIASTSDQVQNLLSEGEKRPFAVSSKLQTNGRGRRGSEQVNGWQSQEGNLFVSFALDFAATQMTQVSLVSIAAATMLTNWLQGYTKNRKIHLPLRIKWPNDLLLEGRKLAGILCESSIQGNEVGPIVIGYGVNLVEFPRDQLRLPAISLASYLQRYSTSTEFDKAYFDAGEAAESLTDFVAQQWVSLTDAQVLADFKKAQLHQGQPVDIDGSGYHLLQSIDHNGNLLFSTEDLDQNRSLVSASHHLQWAYLKQEENKEIPFVCIDVGNTAVKASSFDVWNDSKASAVKIISKGDVTSFQLKELASEGVVHFLEQNKSLLRFPVFVASVNQETKTKLDQRLKELGLTSVNVKKRAVAYCQGNYDFDQLGIDRLALIEGWLDQARQQQRKEKLAIIVGAGTATTIDAVSLTGFHYGGIITAGMQLSLDALANSTGLLPSVSLAQTEQGLEQQGIDTKSAMVTGVLYAAAGAVEKFKQTCLQKLNLDEAECAVVVSGGNGEQLAASLSAEYEPELVLKGLQRMVLF